MDIEYNTLNEDIDSWRIIDFVPGMDSENQAMPRWLSQEI